MSNFLDAIKELEDSFDYLPANNSELQRTEQWYKDRLPCFSGSEMFKLMGCTRAAAKKKWDDPQKILSFGNTAIKYIYKVAQKRRTLIPDMDIYAKSMEHGKDNEALLNEQLLKDGIISSHKEHGFVKFQNMDYAGASPDGEVSHRDIQMAQESKSTTSWDGHYERMGQPFDYKHKDFWQVTAEMIALKMNKCLYVTAYPGVYEQYDYKVIELSKMHAFALIQRLKIANAAVEIFIQEYPAKYINECLELACAEYVTVEFS